MWTYEDSRTFSSEVRPASIHQGRKDLVNSLLDRQKDGIVLSGENWRNRQQYTGKDQQGELGYFNDQRYHNYRRVIAKCSESAVEWQCR